MASPATKGALARSVEHVHDRQNNNSNVSFPRSPNLFRNNVPKTNATSIDTSNDRAAAIKPMNAASPRSPWKSSTVIQPMKTPRSIFLGSNEHPDKAILPPIIAAPYQSLSQANAEITKSVHVVRLDGTKTEEPLNSAPIYIQYPHETYLSNTKLIHTDPPKPLMKSSPTNKPFWNSRPGNSQYQLRDYKDTEIFLNRSEAPVYRYCECCARGRLASLCPSCYFCELFYGCPLYCWLLTLLLLLIPMLALFGWLLSEQPAINPAKRQYITQQTSIVQDDVYAVMHNCAVPYCTNASPATTINQLYQTYHDYSVTQTISNANKFQNFSLISFGFLYLIIAKLYGI